MHYTQDSLPMDVIPYTIYYELQGLTHILLNRISFDGQFRRELHKGDFVRIKMCRFPMATINRLKFTADWFDALRSGFMFNQRPRQRHFLTDKEEEGNEGEVCSSKYGNFGDGVT